MLMGRVPSSISLQCQENIASVFAMAVKRRRITFQDHLSVPSLTIHTILLVSR
ncbi:hypothetical protein ANCCAN_12392 [Ancylostoma caninum]|uniref:Uncharacterized protein n=1 Tax=Ancylostoma caninum TaxID=29170 RepID=A0A368GB55_ANCCA|nr:hypothetical protein ANCCAN_12392 [Ancylostoma caninum]